MIVCVKHPPWWCGGSIKRGREKTNQQHEMGGTHILGRGWVTHSFVLMQSRFNCTNTHRHTPTLPVRRGRISEGWAQGWTWHSKRVTRHQFYANVCDRTLANISHMHACVSVGLSVYVHVLARVTHGWWVSEKVKEAKFDLPGAVCQLKPPMNIFLQHKKGTHTRE